MRRHYALASILALLLTTAYTPRMTAAHRYGWDDRYYVGGTYCWQGLTQVGIDAWPCDGPHNVDGNVDTATFKVTLVVECSSQQITENQLYFDCGSNVWAEVPDTCYEPC
jgi:hypothetical protein